MSDRVSKLLNDPERDTALVTDKAPVTPLVLTGFATATISANGALLKIEVLSPDQSLSILPIAMSRSQCTELSEALSRLAVLPHNPDQKPN
jgi:hypothetical protein